MEPSIYLPALSILANIFVGYILYQKIKSQTDIINHYKGYAESVDPKKIILLQDKQIEKLNEVSETNIKELQTQVFQLANYVDYILTDREWMAKSINQPELFNRQSVININMPSCSRILKNIHDIHESKTPDS